MTQHRGRSRQQIHQPEENYLEQTKVPENIIHGSIEQNTNEGRVAFFSPKESENEIGIFGRVSRKNFHEGETAMKSK